MDKRFWICAAVVGIAALVLDFLIHGLLLQRDYAALAANGLVRGPDAGARYLPWMLLAHAAIGTAVLVGFIAIDLRHARAGRTQLRGVRG